MDLVLGTDRDKGDVQEWKRLMIIKLRKYNKVGELLIEIGTTVSQGHICYQNRDWMHL